MQFDLNSFLASITMALDFVENEALDVTPNHSKRVTYLALKMGKQLNFTDKELYELCTLSLMHDNGLSEDILNTKYAKELIPESERLSFLSEHSVIGEKNIKNILQSDEHQNVLKYHHEQFNGKGYYGLAGNDIPIYSQIIGLADHIDSKFHLENPDIANQFNVTDYVKANKNVLYSNNIVNLFCEVSRNSSFWMDMQNLFIDQALNEILPVNYSEITFKNVFEKLNFFSIIIDSKSKYTKNHTSGLIKKMDTVTDNLRVNESTKYKLMLAANLHDIGKLAIPASILDDTKSLNEEQHKLIQYHTYLTGAMLGNLKDFSDVRTWAANHHEKLNGKGYPYGKKAKDLDFESRLMTCLDIYQALTEERPYRKSAEHSHAIKIMNNMALNYYIDGDIVDIIEKTFRD